MTKLKKGDRVNYHSVIGEGVTSRHHIVKYVEYGPNDYDWPIAWITGKVGCVAIYALSLDEMEPYAMHDLMCEINRIKRLIAGEYCSGYLDDLTTEQQSRLNGQLDILKDVYTSFISHTENLDSDTHATLFVKVCSRMYDIIRSVEWGGSANEDGIEKLQLALSDYIVPLLRKSGWFVDECDGLLTCVCSHHKENEVLLMKRPPDVINEEMQLNLANAQLVARFNSDKMRVAISALRLLETSDRLTAKAVSEIALKALDDIEAIGNPGLEAGDE